MKHFQLLLAVLLFQPFAMVAQEYPNNKFPHVTRDLIDDSPLWLYANHKVTIAGSWGLGLSAQYNKVNQPHVHVEGGYGFMLSGITKSDKFKSKSLRPWIDVFAGYPVFSFKRGVKARYSTAITGDREYFYRIKTPTTSMVIPQVGFRLTPYPLNLYPIDGNGIVKHSAMLPTFNFGIKLLSISASTISIRDKETGKRTTGTTTRMSELYIGMVLPIKQELSAPDENYNGVLANGAGYEIMFKIPYRHNSIGTFEIGLRSTGYSGSGFGVNKTPTQRMAQIVIGNSFYLN